MATTQYVRRKSDIEEQKAIKNENLEVTMPISIRQPNPQLVPIRPPTLKTESSRPRVSKIMRHANFSTVSPRTNLTKFHNSGFQGEINRVTTGSYVKLETKNFSHGVNKNSQITSSTVSAVIPPAIIPTVAPSVISSMTPTVSQTAAPTAIKVFPSEKMVKITNNSTIKTSFKPPTDDDIVDDIVDESAVESKVNEVPKKETKKKHKLENEEGILPKDDEQGSEDQKKRFACPICNRCFARKFNMQTHQTTHEVDRVKPFVCNYPDCDHSFTRKHDLKRHVYGIHEIPEQEFKCSSCSKTFARKDACKRHSFTCRIVEQTPVNQSQDSGPPPRKRRVNNRRKLIPKNPPTADNHEDKATADNKSNIIDPNLTLDMTTDITRCTFSDTMKKSTDSIIKYSTTIDNLMSENMAEGSLDHQMYKEIGKNDEKMYAGSN